MKNKFPIFKKIKEFVYFDSAGTNLKPKCVTNSIKEYYENFSLNNHSNSDSSIHKKIDETIEETRKIIAKKINGKKEEIYFMPSATYSLNILALSLEKMLKKGEIIITKLEHSSNVYPWKRITNNISFFELDKFSVNLKKIDEKISKNTKLVSIFHENNTFGSLNNIEEISKIVKKKNPKCIIIVDACQSIIWSEIDVKKWNIDFLVFSGHKVFGPTGIGILWAKSNTEIEEILFGGGKKKCPELSKKKTKKNGEENKFEIGTLPLAQIFGLKKAFSFVNEIKEKKIKIIEKLKTYTIKIMKNIKEIIMYNNYDQKNTDKNIIFNIKKIHPHDVANYLGKNNIFVRAGDFCCPYLEDVINFPFAIRLSFSLYNTKKDVDALIYQIKKIVKNPEITIEYLIK